MTPTDGSHLETSELSDIATIERPSTEAKAVTDCKTKLDAAWKSAYESLNEDRDKVFEAPSLTRLTDPQCPFHKAAGYHLQLTEDLYSMHDKIMKNAPTEMSCLIPYSISVNHNEGNLIQALNKASEIDDGTSLHLKETWTKAKETVFSSLAKLHGIEKGRLLKPGTSDTCASEWWSDYCHGTGQPARMRACDCGTESGSLRNVCGPATGAIFGVGVESRRTDVRNRAEDQETVIFQDAPWKKSRA